MKKSIVIGMAVLCLLVLCAFSIAPRVQYDCGTERFADVTYNSAQTKDDTIVLTVDYDCGEEPVEIGRDIIVSIEKDLSEPLELKSCSVLGNKRIYTYKNKSSEKVQSVYIAPPILYAPQKTEPISVPLVEDTTVSLTYNDGSRLSAKEWFSINSIEIEEIEKGMSCVRVKIIPTLTELPRFPRLVVNDSVFGGISALNFDQDGDFVSGEFMFYVSEDSAEKTLIEKGEVKLTVENMLVRLEPTNVRGASAVKELRVSGN